jgi:hypothetical protein
MHGPPLAFLEACAAPARLERSPGRFAASRGARKPALTRPQHGGPRAFNQVLGEVDAFVSHSWHDDGDRKMAALKEWAEEFEGAHGRPPTLWLDKGSINQRCIAADLAGLPLYLLGCKSLLVLVGHTYCARLWCVMEIFMYLQMGGKRESVHVIRLQSRCSIANLAHFDLERSTCFLSGDRHRLLGAIEAAFGDFHDFNQAIREIFGERQ